MEPGGSLPCPPSLLLLLVYKMPAEIQRGMFYFMSSSRALCLSFLSYLYPPSSFVLYSSPIHFIFQSYRHFSSPLFLHSFSPFVSLPPSTLSSTTLSCFFHLFIISPLLPYLYLLPSKTCGYTRTTMKTNKPC
jgi:hypothetical protein